MSRWLLRIAGLCLAATCIASYSSAVVRADQPLQSTNYRFDESSIGAGGLIQSSSNNFQIDSALGDLGVGDSASSNFQVQAGSKTTPDPALSFAITSANPDFGSFSSSGTSVATATFSVTNYTSYGYVVQIAGDAPTNGGHTITALSSNDSSQFGIEQFGINLVANSSPFTFGANPDHGQFGVGSAAANYDTPDEFRFVSGETIASAPESSGETIYTISYLVNVSSLTPGGRYTSGQTIVVTGTY
jgi:hypothetical protein